MHHRLSVGVGHLAGCEREEEGPSRSWPQSRIETPLEGESVQTDGALAASSCLPPNGTVDGEAVIEAEETRVNSRHPILVRYDVDAVLGIVA